MSGGSRCAPWEPVTGRGGGGPPSRSHLTHTSNLYLTEGGVRSPSASASRAWRQGIPLQLRTEPTLRDQLSASTPKVGASPSRDRRPVRRLSRPHDGITVRDAVTLGHESLLRTSRLPRRATGRSRCARAAVGERTAGSCSSRFLGETGCGTSVSRRSVSPRLENLRRGGRLCLSTRSRPAWGEQALSGPTSRFPRCRMLTTSKALGFGPSCVRLVTRRRRRMSCSGGPRLAPLSGGPLIAAPSGPSRDFDEPGSAFRRFVIWAPADRWLEGIYSHQLCPRARLMIARVSRGVDPRTPPRSCCRRA